jgi:nicotinate-nucleotide adenylyltransferase
VSEGRRGLALYGGSFNPPHTTHRRIAETALRLLPVEQLLVLPSGDHPHKQQRDMALASHRLAMCQLAFAGIDRCVVDDRELRRVGPSFTVDTLQQLHEADPSRELFFLIGSDNLPLLPSWRDHHRILRLAHVVTFPRLGHPVDAAALQTLDLTANERLELRRWALPVAADQVNASALRAGLRRGDRNVSELAPEVERYIYEHKVYGA